MVQVEYAKPVASLAGINFKTKAAVEVDEGSAAEKVFETQQSFTDYFGLTSERSRNFPLVKWSETDQDLNTKLSSTLKFIEGCEITLPTTNDGFEMSVSIDDLKDTKISFDANTGKSFIAEGTVTDEYGEEQKVPVIRLSSDEVRDMTQGELADKLIHLEMHCKDYGNSDYDDITKEARAVYEESVFYNKMQHFTNEDYVFKPMYTDSEGEMHKPEDYDTAIAVYDKVKSGENLILPTKQKAAEAEKPKEGLDWWLDQGSKLVDSIKNNDATKAITNKIFDPFEDLKKVVELDNDFPLQAETITNKADENPDNI